MTNLSPTLVCSNCTGGFLYHWLGLRFRSPFINLYMTNEDFLTALEHWDEFLKADIKEVTDSGYDYPVGKSIEGTRIHFVHYDSFNSAVAKWNERRTRMDSGNMGIMLTNWDGDVSILERFDRLPFLHKVAFVDKPYPQFRSAFCLKGFDKVKGVKNIYATQHLSGKRYIDQFDYVSFINSLKT